MEEVKLPGNLWFPEDAFRQRFDDVLVSGHHRLRDSSIAFVGLARNCGQWLHGNLLRLQATGMMCKSWKLHVESNDCNDNTLEVLQRFCADNRQATFLYSTLDRPHLPGEFAGPRTIALAEYRDACQRWVRECAADCDYVVVADLDLWGGFSPHGLVSAIGEMVFLPGAYGMASVSLFEHDFGAGRMWGHYDLWALRGLGQRDCYWDQYRGGRGGFGYTWIPPVGSPPALVASAFGGMAIYRTSSYLKGTYDGVSDCEHVPFHRSIAEATGRMLYVCPGMRTVVSWMEPDHEADGIDGV